MRKGEGSSIPLSFIIYTATLCEETEGGNVMTNWFFISILILLPVAWLLLHYSTARKHRRLYSLHNKKTAYAGVSIQPCSTACANAKNLEGKRFLPDEVTVLPILGCTNGKCTCTYMHHNDRRRGIERRLPLSALENVLSKQEQRIRPDRRKHSFA